MDRFEAADKLKELLTLLPGKERWSTDNLFFNEWKGFIHDIQRILTTEEPIDDSYSVKVLTEYEPARLQEELDELCANGYTLHSVTPLAHQHCIVLVRDRRGSE